MDIENIIENLEKFSLKSKSTINWKIIIRELRIPERIIEKYIHEIDINDVLKYQNVSESFKNKYFQ